MTCIGVITPVYYPSLVFLADFKSRDFLGLEMYAYEHTSSTKNAGTHTHTTAWVHAVGCTKRQKKKPSSPTRRHTTLEKSKKARTRIRTLVAGFKVQNLERSKISFKWKSKGVVLTLTNYIIRAARAEREGAQRKGAPANQLTILYDHIVSFRAEFKDYVSLQKK